MPSPPAGDLAYLRHLARRGAANIHPLGRAATRRLLDALELADGQRILELGCGTGETLAVVAASRHVLAVGLDLLPEMLRVARLRLRVVGVRALLVRGNAAAALPLRDASADRVYAESVLGFQGAEAAARLLREIARVLAPGGRFVAAEAVWKRGVDAETVAGVFERQTREFGLAQASPQPWGVPEWSEAMRAAGFSVAAHPLAGPAAASRVPLRAALGTRLVSRWFRIRSLLAGGAREEREWALRLRRHADDGELVEGALFVLDKPGAPAGRFPADASPVTLSPHSAA